MSTRNARLQGGILRWGLRLLSATWRYREEIPPECRPILEGREIAVVAFWHGRMLPVWYRFRGGSFAALVSGSRDGELLAGYLLRGLGYPQVIRGSSSRGGSEALAAIVEVLEERSCLITPDGPRGPAGEAKAGALVAAARAGRRVMAVGWRCRRSWRVRSWDRMEIPYPFSKVYIRYCIFDAVKTGEEKEGKSGEKIADMTDRGAARISDEALRRFARVLDEAGNSSEGVGR